uniref:Uncharacterized protein n=1 Tax=Anguilla anguilla TaxID=7936 RepID=A0A0E9SVG7_ANGAN
MFIYNNPDMLFSVSFWIQFLFTVNVKFKIFNLIWLFLSSVLRRVTWTCKMILI